MNKGRVCVVFLLFALYTRIVCLTHWIAGLLLSGCRVRDFPYNIRLSDARTQHSHIYREGRNYLRLLLVRRINWTVDDFGTKWWFFVVVIVAVLGSPARSLTHWRRSLEINKFETFTFFLLEKKKWIERCALTEMRELKWQAVSDAYVEVLARWRMQMNI